MTAPTDPPSQTDQPADERKEAARRYVQQLRVFYVHAAVFAGSIAIIVAVNLLVNLNAGTAGEWSAWWSLWALIGWGAGIAVHGLVVRLNRPSFAVSTWEHRQIDRMLG
jgi:hypothetical protein